MPILISLLVVLLSILAKPCIGDKNQIMRDVLDIYKNPQDSDPENYFKNHGKSLLEQAAMLDAMALAKRGLDKKARVELKYMAIQSLLAELPEDYRSVGDLVKLIDSDQTYFVNTLYVGTWYQDIIYDEIEKKLSKYRSSSKTERDRTRVKEQIESTLKGEGTVEIARTKLEKVWNADFQQMKRLGEVSGPGGKKEMRAWQVYGKVKLLAKRFKFTVPFGPNGKFGGPVADVLGIVVSSFGLAECIATGDTNGIVKNAIGIVGGLVGLVAFGFVTQGVAIAGPIGALAGAVFFIIPMIVDLLWPSNLAIETANKLSEVSRNDLNGYLSQLKGMREEGKKSFGWIYQANSGVLIKKGITPDSIMKFQQPSCASEGSPCDPKKETYDGKSYLVLGQNRRSTDSRSQFQLDMPYDFIGVPTESRFCGNTITINTWSFRRYIEKLDFELFKWEVKKKIGYYHRNIEIDTTDVPQYNEVDMNEWTRSKRSSISNKTRDKLKDEVEDIKCEPQSDRISIDELEYLDPSTGQIRIETGPGKDLLSINNMIGKVDGSKTNFIVADLGAGVNMLSLGSTLGIGKTEPGQLLVGAVFKNDQGQGQVCYIRENVVTRRCVGNVRNVQIFKGSRLSDTVYIGPDGPFTIIQNHGTNLYYFDIRRIDAKATQSGKMFRYQIMDYSGNTPQIINYNIGIEKRFQIEGVDRKKPGLLYITTDGNRIARIDITGLVTSPDVYQYDDKEYCILTTYND